MQDIQGIEVRGQWKPDNRFGASSPPPGSVEVAAHRVTSAPGLQNLGRLTKELIRHYILWTNLPAPWRRKEGKKRRWTGKRDGRWVMEAKWRLALFEVFHKMFRSVCFK
ncbi:hypothetical protein AVEN_216363-1 [Araneus ventricosus]|uniref:Uncharacterized protein n=1 Tax=Araneus ventricosus TaxID=182803 RepID=A0A4Y2GYP2_ARAVE|nr:hypothetical protein AVEN_216363-1 [Araneus ventricosus]